MLRPRLAGRKSARRPGQEVGTPSPASTSPTFLGLLQFRGRHRRVRVARPRVPPHQRRTALADAGSPLPPPPPPTPPSSPPTPLPGHRRRRRRRRHRHRHRHRSTSALIPPTQCRRPSGRRPRSSKDDLSSFARSSGPRAACEPRGAHRRLTTTPRCSSPGAEPFDVVLHKVGLERLGLSLPSPGPRAPRRRSSPCRTPIPLPPTVTIHCREVATTPHPNPPTPRPNLRPELPSPSRPTLFTCSLLALQQSRLNNDNSRFHNPRIA
jgi:hypothetical protein